MIDDCSDTLFRGLPTGVASDNRATGGEMLACDKVKAIAWGRTAWRAGRGIELSEIRHTRGHVMLKASTL